MIAKTPPCEIWDELAKHSGLDKNTLIQELADEALLQGKNLESLTLEELRPIVAQYVRKTMLELTSRCSAGKL